MTSPNLIELLLLTLGGKILSSLHVKQITKLSLPHMPVKNNWNVSHGVKIFP